MFHASTQTLRRSQEKLEAATFGKEILPMSLELGDRELQPVDVLFHFHRGRNRQILKAGARGEQHYSRIELEGEALSSPRKALPTRPRPEVGPLRAFDIEALLQTAPINKVTNASMQTWEATRRIDELNLSPRKSVSRKGPPGIGDVVTDDSAGGWSRQEDGRLVLPWQVSDDRHYTTNYTGFESREMRVIKVLKATNRNHYYYNPNLKKIELAYTPNPSATLIRGYN